MEAIGKLFGGNKGPSAAEQAMQADRAREANRANAEADASAALATRATSLRRTLAYRDESKKGTLGG